jgi:hypothetical protein
MTNRGQKVFDWISTLLLFFGLYLTGAFGKWGTLISPNPYWGWSIVFSTIVAGLFFTWFKTPQENSFRNEGQLEGWEKTRIKGKLHYVLIQGPMLPLLVIAVTIILLQISGVLGEDDSFNLYTVAVDAAILAAFYGIRIKEWTIREEKYQASLISKDAGVAA